MKPNVSKAFAKGLLVIAALVIVAALTGCTLNVGADGSKSVTVDGPSVLRAATILAEK